ncbi:hypothetical protein NLX67_21875 [Domibacillus sp. A3M-37]|uniref:hypothetical protein n=1 Tax=Domibacillus sp. A3M-37 TaxID=2962037 RepID=UPI0020B7DA34|nr:hypothetical protein [Domibacillus sp. A3M-37]MCP3764965.1 hypothetical protein [Domibacillus sp. A3M-37]
MSRRSFGTAPVLIMVVVIYQFSWMLYRAITGFDWGTFGSDLIAFLITASCFFVILKIKKDKQ